MMRRQKTVRHLQPDLSGRHIGKGLGIARLIDPGDRRRISGRNDLPVGEREIQDREVAMLMAHRRAEGELSIDQAGNDERENRQ